MSRLAPCRRPELAELVSSYVLGACTDEESVAVRRHLSTCASCTAALTAFAPAREGLLADVARVEPPQHLKSEVMRQVRAEAALFEAARAPERPARRRFAPRPAWALAVAAFAALVVVFAYGGTVRDRETVYAARVDGVVAPGGRASIKVHGRDVRLQVSGLPAAGAGRRYEVWMRDETGKVRPANVSFAVDAKGSADATMPGVPRPGEQVMVTSEVGGNAAAPTRAAILRVSL
jgi:anti-sigma-K factor RskA/putative zinc finger protein